MVIENVFPKYYEIVKAKESKALPKLFDIVLFSR